MTTDQRWTAEDHAEELARARYGNQRLEAWARWQRNTGIRLDYPGESSFVRAMDPTPTEDQAGARHCAAMPTDAEAEAVDRVLAAWRAFRTRYWKIVDVEYRTAGSSERKARRVGMKRIEYRKRLERVQSLMADALDSGADSRTHRG